MVGKFQQAENVGSLGVKTEILDAGGRRRKSVVAFASGRANRPAGERGETDVPLRGVPLLPTIWHSVSVPYLTEVCVSEVN